MSQTGQPALTTHPTTATPPHPTSPTCPLSSSSTAPPSEIPESAVVTSPPVSPHSQRMASEKSSSPANPDVGQSADPVNQDKVSGSGQGVGGTPTTPRAPRSALYPSLLPVRSREPGETASRNLTVTNATAPPPLTVSGPPQRSPSLSSALSHEGQSAPWSSLWLHNPKPFSATPSIKTDDVSIITSLTSKHLHIDGYGPDSEEPMVETVLKHARRTLPGETASVVSAEPAVAAGKTADKEELLDQGSADINEAIQMRRVRSRMLLHWRPNFKELRDLLGLEYRFIKPKSLMALDRRILKQGWYELIPWYPERSPASCHESHLDFLSERPDCLTGPSSPRPSAVQPEEQLADDGDDGSCDSVIAHSDEESEVAPLKPTSLGATTAAYAPKLIQPVTPSAQVTLEITHPISPGIAPMVLDPVLLPPSSFIESHTNSEPSGSVGRNTVAPHVLVVLTSDSLIYGYSVTTSNTQVAVDNPSFIPCEEAFVLPLHGVDLEPFFAGIRVYHNGNPVVAFNTDIAPEWLDAFITAKSAHQIRDESRRSRENKAMKQWKFPDYNKPSDQDKRFWRYWRSSSVSKQPRSQPTPNKKPASYTVAAGRSSSGEISAPMAPNSSASGRPQSSGPTSPKHTNVLSVLHSSAESHSHQRKTSIGSFRALWTGGSSTGTTSIQPKAVTVTQTTSSTAAQSLTSTLSSLGTQPPPFFGKLGSNQEGAATEFGTQLSRPGSPATLGDTLGGVVSCEWVPDDAVTVCMVCRNTVFTLLVRKHHCRHCGRVICYRCSVMAASRGDKLVRLCTECSQRYQVVSPAVSPTLHRIRRDTTPVNDRHGGGSPLDAHNSPPCTLVHMGTGSPLSPLFHRRHVSPTKPHSHAPQPMAIPQSPRHLAGRRRRPVSLAVGPQCSRQRTVSLGRASGYRHPLSLDDRPCSPRPLSASVTGNTYDPYHPNPEATSPTHTTMSIPDLPSKNPLHPNPSCPVMTTDSIGQPTSDLPMSCSFDAILNPFREHRPSSPSLGRSHEVNGRARANSLLCGLSPPSAFPRGRVLAGMNYPSHESLAQALAPTSVTHAGTHASTGPSSATLTPSSSFANVPHHMVSSQSTHTHTPSHYPPSISILHTGATMPFKSQTCHPPPPGPYGNPALWYIPPWATTPVFGSIESTLTTVSDIPSLGTSHRMALVNQGIDPPAGSSTHPRRRAQPMQSITTFSFRKPDTLDPPVLTHRVQNNESPPPNDKPSLAPRVPTNPADSCHDTSHPAT